MGIYGRGEGQALHAGKHGACGKAHANAIIQRLPWGNMGDKEGLITKVEAIEASSTKDIRTGLFYPVNRDPVGAEARTHTNEKWAIWE